MTMKNAYERKLQAQLDEWDAEIKKLKARADRAEADARIDYQETIQELEHERREAEAKLEELRQSGEDAWEDLKAGMELAWDNLDHAFKRAASRFK